MKKSTGKNETRISDIPLGFGVPFRTFDHTLKPASGCERSDSINIHLRTVVMNSSQLICEVHNTRIGLHRRIANEIIIELAGEQLHEEEA